MKAPILKLIALLAILISSGEALAAIPPRGLVLYTEPPADYVLNLEFVTLTHTSVAYATVSTPNGKKQEIPRGGIVAIINYPPEVPTESLPQDAATATQAIKAARAKYPQFTAKLDAALSKWTNSLEVFRQRQKLAKPTVPQSGSALTLEVDGVAYMQVVLTSFDGATVGVAHAAGVARIAAIKLKAEQIAALNATSTSVRIEPSKIVLATPAPVAIKENPAGQPVPSMGAGGQRRIAPIPGKELSPAEQRQLERQNVEDELLRNAADRKVMQVWLATPVRADEFIEPEGLRSIPGPSYAETIEFINGKIGPLISVGFGKVTRKMIYRRAYNNSPGTATAFDLKNLNAEVRYEKQSGVYGGGLVTSHRVILQGRNRKPEFTTFQPMKQGNGPIKISQSAQPTLTIPVRDDIDAKKLAEAFSHLIYMFGGEAEAF